MYRFLGIGVTNLFSATHRRHSRQSRSVGRSISGYRRSSNTVSQYAQTLFTIFPSHSLHLELNTPRSSYHALRPYEIIDVLTSQSEGRTNSLLLSREHQDAQELFQLLSECIKNEIAAVDKEGYRDRGLGGLAKVSADSNREIGKSVFDGLTANRRSCITCGYTEAVMHFALDNWQLAVPRMAVSLAFLPGQRSQHPFIRQVVPWSGA